MSLSIYLIRPDWRGDPDDAHEAVVDSLPNGPTYIDVAIELWRLAGNEERAAKVYALTTRAFGRGNKALHTEEIREFHDLLLGLGDALRQTVVDSESMIAPERLPEMRRRTTLVDLGEHRGDLAVYGISEAIGQVCELECFLKKALDRGLYVALD
jgi:hypothetical protein